jgi:transposase
MVKGTVSEAVITVLQRIPESIRNEVKEITLDMAGSMNRIAHKCFPKSTRVIDHFYVKKLAYDALQEMRIGHRWEAINKETNEIQNAKENNTHYTSLRFDNGDTPKQLLAKSRYLLFKSPEKWSKDQKKLATLLFAQYPDIKRPQPYALAKANILEDNGQGCRLYKTSTVA